MTNKQQALTFVGARWLFHFKHQLQPLIKAVLASLLICLTLLAFYGILRQPFPKHKNLLTDFSLLGEECIKTGSGSLCFLLLYNKSQTPGVRSRCLDLSRQCSFLRIFNTIYFSPLLRQRTQSLMIELDCQTPQNLASSSVTLFYLRVADHIAFSKDLDLDFEFEWIMD